MAPRKPEDATPAPESLDHDPMERRRRRGFEGPEAALAITALLDLHRTAGTGAQTPTVRGRKPDGTAPRYLEAARALGDELVANILGPETADR